MHLPGVTDDPHWVLLDAHFDPQDAETRCLTVERHPFHRAAETLLVGLGIEDGAHGRWVMVYMPFFYPVMTRGRQWKEPGHRLHAPASKAWNRIPQALPQASPQNLWKDQACNIDGRRLVAY